ncbi:hypothetical protein Dcae01_01130 [Deinococcus caeni]|uniref:Uncharacterized protein n=1 Tax=Deinococcus caeni TaxID=569127 RepID=A0ABP9UB89_9DEIO
MEHVCCHAIPAHPLPASPLKGEGQTHGVFIAGLPASDEPVRTIDETSAVFGNSIRAANRPV